MTTASTTAIMDVRGFRDPECSEMVLGSFDTLAPGDSLVVVGDQAPRELLRRLQVERKGAFEWSPLEHGPSCFRTELTRRDAPRGALRGITEALAWDHDRLDGIEQEAFARLAAGDQAGARAAWSEFCVGLRRHIRFEEELLFPTFEARLGMPPAAGPTAVMRAEHRQIEELIEAIGGALLEQAAALRLRAELHRVLGDHNLKEERMLYPATDQALDPEERDALVARIQAS